MENQIPLDQGPIISRAGSSASLQTFIAHVFSWMTAALVITAVAAYWFAADASLFNMLYKPSGGMSMMGWVVMFAPLGMVLIMGTAIERMSYQVLMLLFIVFSVVMGISMSYIFHVFDLATISKTFFITAGTFGTMAILGYTTKTDLSKMGRILFMGLIGIILASVVNFFTGSSQMDYVISILGVIIFTGLTAYDMQRIKQIGMQVEGGSDIAGKAAIMGALSLYLDFVNLFLFLLRLLGSRD